MHRSRPNRRPISADTLLPRKGHAYGRALHRAVRKHRARLKVQREQAVHRRKAYRYLSCERKTRYETEAYARGQKAKQEREGGVTLYVYGPCRFCQGWHLTKSPPKRGA